ncbi:hypothetical protein ACLB2K_025491 [Fragaria x ananassa]
MVGSGELDLENQQTAPPVAIDRGSGLLISFLNRICSLCQFLTRPSSADDESEELELTKTYTAHLAPHVSEEVSSLSVEDDCAITSSATVSDQVNLKIEDDIATDEANKIQHANISKIIREKDFATLQKFGGIEGIAEALGTDLHNGIPGDGQNLHDQHSAGVSTTQAPTPSFFKLLLRSCFNWTFLLLLVSIFLLTVFGIQQEGPTSGWLEGAVGAFAIIMFVVVSTMRKCFLVPHSRNTARQVEVKVRRGGNLLHVSPSDVVPGDIVCLELGSIVPAEGLYVMTGESLLLEDGIDFSTVDDSNPFLVYGARVVNGNGRMLVTCVGMGTALGELMGQVRCAPNQDQLLAQLDKLSTRLQNVGHLITILTTLVLFIRSLVLKDNEYPGLQADQLKGKTAASEELIHVIGRFFMKSSGGISVATYLPLLIVGLSEGVPFSVALAITYWTKATLFRKAIAQRTLACFAMGFVSTICIGGGLTSNPVLEVDVSYDGNQIIDIECVAEIKKHVREALYKGIGAPLMMPSPCSSTEHQLLLPWAKSNLGLDNENLLKSCTIEKGEKLSSDEETSRVLMKDSETGDMCLYWSGPETTILPMCSEYYDSNGTTKLMDEQKKRDFKESISNMQSKHLKTIAFAHKKIDALMSEEEDQSLILIALLGVNNGCTETMEALEVLRKAGVDVIEFPKDTESVLSEGESPIYGMGRPSDKLHTVQRLKDKGHVVAMVGTRTNETPAIKEADVGIAMGTSISEIARVVSDLVIHYGSPSFLVNIIRTGRCIYYNIQKYIQVELTTNISLLVIILVTTISLGHCTIGAFEALWATILVTVCALALLLEPPTEELMEKTPIKQTESLISKHMWRNVLLQALYQASISVALQLMKWKALPDKKTMESIVFNIYVLCQVFNLVSAREPEKKNIFRGILRTPWLWVAVVISIPMQVALIEIAHKVAGNARLDWGHWGVCLLVAMFSWLIDLAGKCVWGCH